MGNVVVESVMIEWDPNRWIVEQNIARLSRWIETDRDENHLRKLRELLAAEKEKLDALEAAGHHLSSDESDDNAFWGS